MRMWKVCSWQLENMFPSFHIFCAHPRLSFFSVSPPWTPIFCLKGLAYFLKMLRGFAVLCNETCSNTQLIGRPLNKFQSLERHCCLSPLRFNKPSSQLPQTMLPTDVSHFAMCTLPKGSLAFVINLGWMRKSSLKQLHKTEQLQNLQNLQKSHPWEKIKSK